MFEHMCTIWFNYLATAVNKSSKCNQSFEQYAVLTFLRSSARSPLLATLSHLPVCLWKRACSWHSRRHADGMSANLLCGCRFGKAASVSHPMNRTPGIGAGPRIAEPHRRINRSCMEPIDKMICMQVSLTLTGADVYRDTVSMCVFALILPFLPRLVQRPGLLNTFRRL